MAHSELGRVPAVYAGDQGVHAIVQRFRSETSAGEVGHAFLCRRAGFGYEGFAKRPAAGPPRKQGARNKIGRGSRGGYRLSVAHDISLARRFGRREAVRVQSGVANERVKDRIRRLDGIGAVFDQEPLDALRTDDAACTRPGFEYNGVRAGKPQPERRRQSRDSRPYYRYAHGSIGLVRLPRKK